MADDVVVVYRYKDPLTTEMVQAGQRLLDELDASGHPPAVCFWLFKPEAERWHLHFMGADYREMGARVLEALDRLPDIESTYGLLDIVIAWPDDLVVRALRTAMDRGYKEGTRIKRSWFDGDYIEDAYVYRMR